MDNRNGTVYPSRQEAKDHGVPAKRTIQFDGFNFEAAYRAVHEHNAKNRRRAKNRVARKSRRQNRGR